MQCEKVHANAEHFDVPIIEILSYSVQSYI